MWWPRLTRLPLSMLGPALRTWSRSSLPLRKNGYGGPGAILLEEPEAHLSYASLNALLEGVRECLGGQQVVASTHGSFVGC